MRKNIALILALVMILSLIPMSAFAASDNSIDRVPTVGEDFTFTATNAPVLRIEERNPGEFGTSPFTFRVNLTNAEFATGFVAAVAAANPAPAPAVGMSATASLRTDTSVNITVNPGAVNVNERVLLVPLVTQVEDAGEARVTIDPLGTAVSGGTWTFAVVAEGDTIATVTGDTTVGRGTSDAGTILIDEASVSALGEELQQFRLRLPRDVRWAEETEISFDRLNVTNVEVWSDGQWNVYTPGPIGILAEDLPNTGRDLIVRFDVTSVSGTRGTIVIDSEITVSRSASFGDIAVTLTGQEGQISNASNLVIAEYVDFAAAVDVDEVIEMYAGRYDDEYEITIEIDPQLEFSLAQGRFIEFELPSWAAFVEEDTNDGVRINDQTREYAVTGPDAASTSDLEFTFTIVASGTAVPMGDVMRELEMTVGGAGVPETTLVVAEVLAPVTVEVAEQTTPIEIGLQRQAAPEITITENYPGAIMEGDLVVFVRDQFENSMRFDNVDYEVLEGDIEIDDVSIPSANNHRIVIEVDVPSDDEAAVIRLYNIEMTLDRTVPMGPFRLDVGGSALIDYEVDANTVNPWEFATRVARFDYITVGTPIDGVPAPVQVAFTVGQMAYWVDGEMMMMDVAPFISEGRIMIPVRYMEELFGMQPIWNPMARTVTVMYNNQVFEMTIGSTMLRVNGAPFMEMDAEAMIVDSRTFVPLSRFARAMNIPYVWDAATQTVTFN